MRFPSAIFEKLGLGLLGLALPLAFYPGAEDAYRLPQLIVLALALACLSLGRRDAAPRSQLPQKLGIAFFTWRLLTHAAAGPRLDWICEQALYFLAFLWASQHLHLPTTRRRFVAAVLCGAALAAAYGILQSLGWDPFGSGTAEMGFGRRAYSSLGNPNFWGGYLVLVLPLALGIWLHANKGPWLAGLLGLSLALSQTRAAWLGVVAAVAALLARGQAAGRRRLAFAAAAFALVLALTSWARLNLKEASRPFMARVTLAVAAKHPVAGVGGGNFTGAYLAEQGRLMARPGHAAQPYRFTHDAHNDWLQLAAEAGLVGLGLFAALFVLALRSAWKREPALAAALAGFGVNALLHFPSAIVPSAALVWVMLGWAGGTAAGDGRGRGPGERVWHAKPLRLSGFVVAVLAAGVFGRQLMASSLLNRAMSLSLADRHGMANPLLQAAGGIRPGDQRIWMRLGLNKDALGDLMGAENAFRFAILALPELPEAWTNLGLAQGKAGRLEEARQSCLRALELNPRSLEALGNLGKIEYMRGRVPEAVAAYERGLAIEPNWALGLDALRQLGGFNARP